MTSYRVSDETKFKLTNILTWGVNKDKHSAEIRRYNLATEELSAAREKWYENNTAKKDRTSEMKEYTSSAGMSGSVRGWAIYKFIY